MQNCHHDSAAEATPCASSPLGPNEDDAKFEAWAVGIEATAHEATTPEVMAEGFTFMDWECDTRGGDVPLRSPDEWRRRFSEFREDTPFGRALTRLCETWNEFGAARGWPGLGDPARRVEPENVRATARALRDSCYQLAEMPDWTSETQSTGANADEKARLLGYLLWDAAAHNEPWLFEVAKRMAALSGAAHPEHFYQPDDGEAQ